MSLLLLLVFTIKQKQIGNKNMQPPQKLQFHADKFSKIISNQLQLHKSSTQMKILQKKIEEVQVMKP